MSNNAFSNILLAEISDAARHPLATASRERLLSALASSADLDTLKEVGLLDIMTFGRGQGDGVVFEPVLRNLTLTIGEKVSPKDSFLPTDIDDRLRAAILITQKYPEDIPHMLSSLWGIYRDMKAYTADQNITPQSQGISEYDTEVFNLMDIIDNIAPYAISRIPLGSYPTLGTYLFSGRVDDLKCLLDGVGPLFEVYTHPDDIHQDILLQDFIQALKRNKHIDLVLRHEFTKKTPFIEALLEVLRSQ